MMGWSGPLPTRIMTSRPPTVLPLSQVLGGLQIASQATRLVVTKAKEVLLVLLGTRGKALGVLWMKLSS